MTLIGLLARMSYRAGRRRASACLSAELTAELRRHKLECLREPPERVELEIELLLGTRPAAQAERNRRVAMTAARWFAAVTSAGASPAGSSAPPLNASHQRAISGSSISRWKSSP